MSAVRWRTQNKSSPDRGLRIGLTGGIGSGKSLAGEAFKRLGRTVLSADRIARQISDSDPATRREIKRLLGRDAYLPGGILNRPRIASIVFSQPRLLARLNRIIHPRVFRAIERTLRGLPLSKRRPYLLVEAALIFESGMDKTLDYIIVVDAPMQVRLRRVMKRDGVTATSVRRRMQSQMSAKEKRRRASFLLKNHGTRKELVNSVQMLDRILLSISRGNDLC